MKILITGGAGFIGSNFANKFADENEIVAIDNLFLGDETNLQNSKVKFVRGDAAEISDLKKCGKKFDAILHLAGTSSAPMFLGEKMRPAFRNSTESFLAVLEFAKICGAGKILFASTSSLYGNWGEQKLTENLPPRPTNFYATSKIFYEFAGENFQKLNPEIDIFGFRFMSVFGPNEYAKGKFANVLSQFIWDFARGKTPVIFGDGTQTRDFTFVGDLVDALFAAMKFEKKLGFQIFNIGTGKSFSLNSMTREIRKYFPKSAPPKFIENPVRENYILSQTADISKIQKILNWSPKTDLKSGVKLQIENLEIEKIRETSSDGF